MAKKQAATPVVDELNDGWQHIVGEGGQGELVQAEPVAAKENGNGHHAAAANPDVWATLGEPRLVSIDSIQPNPYQPRTGEDLAAIAEIALSIYRNGLMQIPAARANGALVQLAFGHTRFAAFALLATKGLPEQGIAPDKRYAHMPLRMVELDDQKMFEVAVSENIKRRELNTMEQAAAMRAYMDEFGASSKQAAELFSVSDATVRGTIRLLNLPESVQDKIAKGEISQGAARQLLQVSRLAADDQVAKMATAIAGGEKPESAVYSALGSSKGIVKMAYVWSSDDPAKASAGDGLWLLGEVTAPDILKELTPNDLGKLGLDEVTPRTRQKFYLQELRAGKDAAALAEQNPADADAIEKIAHLLRPPACMSCPFHVLASKQHMCGLKLCHDRRAAVWSESEVQTLSTKMDIPVYDRVADGNAAPLQENYWPNEAEFKAHAVLVEKKDPGLRLAAHRGGGHHRWTGSYNVRIVAVGDLAQKIQTDHKAYAENKKTAEASREQVWALERARGAAARKFYEKHVPMLFASAVSGLGQIAVICALLGEKVPKEGKRSAVLPGLHVQLADLALSRGFWGWDKGPIEVAKHFVKVAADWGVALPADFLDVAKSFEPKPVSTETPKGKKKAAAAPVVDEDIDDEEAFEDEEDTDDGDL